MRTILILTIFLYCFNYLNAQITGNLIDLQCPHFGFCGCTGYNCAPKLEVDTANQQNIWQFGHTIKPFLCWGDTISPIIITDTLNSYPPNNSSSFEMKIFDFPGWINCFGDITILFDYMMDTDTLKDGFFIEISLDNKQTWLNLVENSTNIVFYGASYSLSDSLFNGNHGISGRRGYTQAGIGFKLNQYLDCHQDSFYLRFTFISDSIDNHKEGVRIFDVFITVAGYYAAINQNKVNTSNLPTELIRCSENQFDECYHNAECSLTDITGRVISSNKLVNNRYWIDCNISPGIYILNLKSKNFLKKSKILIK